MRILLVTMPWASLETPSIALGVLHACAERDHPEMQVDEMFANLRWAEYLYERTAGEVTPENYLKYSLEGYFQGVGDWVFRPALYDDPPDNSEAYFDYVRRQLDEDFDPALTLRLQQHVRPFCDLVAREIASTGYDLVGFTTTFLQTVAALAVARRVKEASPATGIVFGGANCDGVQGTALHRNHPFVDYVVRGEGERAFPGLLGAHERLTRAGDRSGMAAVPGLCWREPDGSPISNPDPLGPVPISEVPGPNYDSYFRAVRSSPLDAYVEPQLIVESARGCWWGEKHHCTFCGLNGTTMKFRSKPAEVFFDEIARLVRRHRVLDLVVVDNILDMQYLKTLVPRISAARWDLRIHYEVKSNLTGAQLADLLEAGVVHIQPGIESLSSRVLRLMDKGVTAAQNVRLLRDCQELGVTSSWNILYGFPGEAEDDYRALLTRIPDLYHLQPPSSANRIALERFSPYFNRAELGFAFRRPAKLYDYIYDGVPRGELDDMVYLFECENRGIEGDLETEVQDAAGQWSTHHPRSSLHHRDVDGGRAVAVEDRRAGRPPRDLELSDPLDVAAFHEVRRPCTASALASRMAGRLEREVTAVAAAGALSRLAEDGLLFEDEGRYVGLSVHYDPRVVRL